MKLMRLPHVHVFVEIVTCIMFMLLHVQIEIFTLDTETQPFNISSWLYFLYNYK